MGVFACSRTRSTPKPTSSSADAAAAAAAAGGNVDLACGQLAVTAAKTPSFSLASNSRALSLIDLTPADVFMQEADNFVDAQLNPNIVATPKGLGLQVQGEIAVRDYQLSIQGVPLCGNELSIYGRPNQELWMKGNVPSIEGLDSSVFDSISNLEFPSESFAVSSVYSKLNLKGAVSKVKTTKQCIIFENGSFIPAREISFTVNRRPYYGLATTQGYGLVDSDPVRAASPSYLEEVSTSTSTSTNVANGSAVGTASVSSLQVNSLNGSSQNVYVTKTVQLTGLSNGGSLCSAPFVLITLTGPSSAPVLNPPPFSTSENFVYPDKTSGFYSVTTFYNAMSHVDWLLKNGYLSNWPGPQVQIVLNLIDSNGDGQNLGRNNIAVFLPNGNSLTDPPQIELGNGDGKLLQNLWSDPDAIQHETGHHLVYTRLTQISNKISVVIHEGYADSQVLLQNQSPCLGTTICPTGAAVCISNACLRSAANNFTMAAPNCPSDGSVGPPQCLPTEVHQRSQLISGLMWDIAQDIGPANGGYEAALKLQMDSIPYLSSSSEYGDLLEALIKADQDLGGSPSGKYQAHLIKEMCARGFDNAANSTNGKSWMSQISVSYTCPEGSGAIPTGALQPAPLTSGALNIPTTVTGGQ